ncbi:DUF3500 domain-containing protein [Actinoplanes sp. NPDC049596]|uniref:DUF3500 domain-containing protein n=1 Tax=unclassified Actinoplanes TaxID=2626549 RepID=UPI00342DE42B
MTDERRGAARAMAEAARAWLEMLDAGQRTVATGEVAADERRRWFYTPTDHGGLTLHQQRPGQQRAAMRLVAAGLSRAGYVTVATIIGLENILDHTEGFTARFGRERGRDPGLYYLRVFGEPSAGGTWGWRFGGHHVSLNNLVVDGVLLSTTPCFLGADPASAELLGGASSRPLGRVEDLGRELAVSLGEAAILSPKAPSDLVTGNRSSIAEGDRVIPLAGIWRAPFSDPGQWASLRAASDAIDEAAAYGESEHRALEYTARPKGVPARDLDERQRALLDDLVRTYVERGPVETAYDLETLSFGWAGDLTPGAPHYYRVQGPRLLLEWDNTQRNANHAHSVWRDPANDFGLDALAEHRRRHH